MKAKPPIDAIQYSRCLLALTAVRMAVHGAEWEKLNKPLQEKLKRVEWHYKMCRDTMPERKLSAGAMRDFQKATKVLAEGYNFEGENLDHALGVAFWCADGLLLDCKCTCPTYYKRDWKELSYLVEEMALSLNAKDKSIEEAGYALYEQAAI